MSKPEVIFVHELVEKNGKTVRENNLALRHNIPMGALVEILDTDSSLEEGGCRLFVVAQGRDCDGTPLYWLSFDPNERGGDIGPPIRMPRWTGGWSEESLKVIR